MSEFCSNITSPFRQFTNIAASCSAKIGFPPSPTLGFLVGSAFGSGVAVAFEEADLEDFAAVVDVGLLPLMVPLSLSSSSFVFLSDLTSEFVSELSSSSELSSLFVLTVDESDEEVPFSE